MRQWDDGQMDRQFVETSTSRVRTQHIQIHQKQKQHNPTSGQKEEPLSSWTRSKTEDKWWMLEGKKLYENLISFKGMNMTFSVTPHPRHDFRKEPSKGVLLLIKLGLKIKAFVNKETPRVICVLSSCNITFIKYDIQCHISTLKVRKECKSYCYNNFWVEHMCLTPILGGTLPPMLIIVQCFPGFSLLQTVGNLMQRN